MINEFGALSKTTFTSFKYDYIKAIKACNPEARVGWLVCEVTDETIEKLHEIGGEEMAPLAENLTDEIVKKLRLSNLGVRAWGISSVDIMKRMCNLNVDGMTVNFPDRLFQFLKNK